MSADSRILVLLSLSSIFSALGFHLAPLPSFGTNSVNKQNTHRSRIHNLAHAPLRMRGGDGNPLTAQKSAIDFYYWPVPCGWKVAIMFEECGLPYKVHPINILKGDQFDPEYLKLNPNNKVPTIVDPDGPNGQPFCVFESGAILLYLGEKADCFLGGPPGSAARHTVVQWLMFQMASVGPMFGQNGYFRNYARGTEEELSHGRHRYSNETHRIYRVMDKRLSSHAFLAGNDYTIADMAVFPWIQPQMHGEDLLHLHPNVRRWYETVKARPAVQRAYSLLADECKIGDKSDSTHKNLFERQREVGAAPPAPTSRSAAEEGASANTLPGSTAKSSDGVPEIELWYTPIANHVHAVEAVINHCELEAHVRLTPTNPFKVQEEPARRGYDTLATANPLLTVPAMRAGADAVYGGPVIYEYLNSLRVEGVPSLFPAEGAAAIRTRRILWLADGLFDQFVRLLLEDLEEEPRSKDVLRLWCKIEGALDALDKDAGRWQSDVAPLDIAQIRAACTLDFISQRQRPAEAAERAGAEGAGKLWSWRTRREELSAWFDATHCLPPFQSHLADSTLVIKE